MKRERSKSREKGRRKNKRAEPADDAVFVNGPGDIAFGGIAFQLSTTAEAADRYFARGLLLQFRLSIAEWRVLATLASGGTIDTADVIARTRMDRVRVSRAVLKLCENGMVTRVVHPKDQRAQKLALSESGQLKFPAIKAYAEATEAALHAALSDKQRRRLEKILPLLVAAARTQDDSG